jgi:RecB family endonuclease NucS
MTKLRREVRAPGGSWRRRTLVSPTRFQMKSSSQTRSLDDPMRLIVARCSVIYSDRLDTVLPEALR